MIIEQRGTGGTSEGRFTRRRDAARVTWDEEGRVATLTSTATGEPLSEIDTAYMTVQDAYDGQYLGRGNDWHGAVRLALGAPGYGYAWYAVKGRSRAYVPPQAR